MDPVKISPCCNCRQNFSIIAFQYPLKGRLPYTLKCGHSTCERCLYNFVGSSQPIKCSDCNFISELPPEDGKRIKDNINRLKQMFPINYFILGQITYASFSVNNTQSQIAQQNMQYVPAGMAISNYPKPRQAYNYPQIKTKNDIERFVSKLTICKEHNGKSLDFFCKICDKSICSVCLVNTCSAHKFVLANSMNEDCESKVLEGKKVAKEMSIRLENTIKQLEKQRFTAMYGSVSIKPIESSIVNLFSQLEGKLLIAQKELLNQVHDSKNSFENFMSGLKDSFETILTLLAAADNALQDKDKSNLPAMVSALQSVADIPWYLEDGAAPSPNIELEVDQQLMENISNICKLKMDYSKFKLLSTSQLPSYMDVPSLPIEDISETGSLKSEASATSTQTLNTIDMNNLDFEFRKKPPSKQHTSYQNKMGVQHVNYVKPLPNVKSEEKPIRPLTQGMEEKVQVTHIDNPHKFFIQRCIVQNKIHQLSEHYNQIKETLVEPDPATIKPGDIFITFDNIIKWTRVIILNDENAAEGDPDKCLVKFVDHGHTATIAKRRLRVMTEPFVAGYAVQCSLAECEPVNGQWTEEDNQLIKKIIKRSNSACTMTVLGTQEGVYLVDLRSNPMRREESQTSLRDALIFLGRARLFSSVNNKVYRQSRGADFHKGNTSYFHKQRLSDLEEVVITAAIGPNKFYVRKKQLISYFKNLDNLMNAHYSLENETGIVYSPTEDMCVACFVDSTWWRGKIVQLKPNSRLQVFLVDKGTEYIVPWDHIRILVPKFFKSEELVTECRLANIKPVTGDSWNADAVACFTSLVREGVECRTKLVAVVKKKKIYHLYEQVLLYVGEDDICMNVMFVDKGYAVAHGYVASLLKPASAPVASTSSTNIKSEAVTSKPEVNPLKLKTQETGPIKLEVSVLNVVSPSEIYIKIKSEEDEKELKNLYKDMLKTYKTSKPDNSCQWKENDICAILSKRKNKWSRATVDNVNQETKQAKVFLRDYGISELASFENIRPLPPRFSKVRDGALKCHLSGMCPASGDKWPMLTCESLQEIVDMYDKFFITKDGDIVDKSLPVELWIIHITPGGALTPTVKEFRKVNDMIIENGLAIPTRVLKKKEVENVVARESPEVIEPNVNEEMNPPIAAESWLPAVLKNKEFTAVSTYVEDNLDIFLYDVEENSSNLELLGNVLTNYFENSKPKPYDLFWFEGQICVAKFDGDNKYYRAQVISITDNNMALVRFVDYGNTQLCPISSLRKDIVMDDVPIQNYRCKLHGIKPANGDKWDENIGDLVHKSIVDKQSLVTVVGEPGEDGIIPIRLKVNMIYDLSDLLVKLKHAVKYMPEKPREPPKDNSEEDPDIVVEGEIPSFESSKIDWCEPVNT